MDSKVKETQAVAKFHRNEKIGFGSFLAITSSMVLTVYEYPMFAAAGWSVILFLILAGACFFLPIAMTAAEMGTVKKWDKHGIYIWVSETLGRRWGSYAIFFQWLGITDAFLAMVYYLVSGFGFVFGGVHGFNLLTMGGAPAYTGVYNAFSLNPVSLNPAFLSASHITITATQAAEWKAMSSTAALSGLNASTSGYQTSWQALGLFPVRDAQVIKMFGVAHILALDEQILHLNMSAVNPAHPLKLTEVCGAIFGVALLIFFAATASQMFGVKWTGRVSKLGFWGGIALTTFVIFVLGCVYVAQGHPIWQDMSPQQAVAGGIIATPKSTMGTTFTRGEPGEVALLAFVSIILAFMGPEGSGNLANDLRNVNKNYPLAVFILMSMSVGFSSIAGTFIAISQQGAINQVAGISIALTNFMMLDTNINILACMAFSRFWVFMICIGIYAEIATWVVGPVTGLQTCASHGMLPKIFTKKNRFDIPWFNILIQTSIVVILELIVTIGLGFQGGSSFSTGMDISVIIYLLAYYLMWTGYIRMLVKAHTIPRAFKMKSRGLGITLAILGIMCSALGWCCTWINDSGAPNSVFYCVIFFISLWFVLIAVCLTEGYMAYILKKCKEKYGFKLEDWQKIGKNGKLMTKHAAEEAFLKHLQEEGKPEVAGYIFPDLHEATPEELEDERLWKEELKREDAESLHKKRQLFHKHA